jgi:hypothetical protein
MAANIHLDNEQFSLLVTRVGRSFDGQALVVTERENGNAIVFARKDGALVACEHDDAIRPSTLEEAQWNPLQTAFGRIRAALETAAPRGRD